MIEYREGPCPLCWRQWSSSCSSPGLWRCSGWCSSPGVIPFSTQISISIYTATQFSKHRICQYQDDSKCWSSVGLSWADGRDSGLVTLVTCWAWALLWSSQAQLSNHPVPPENLISWENHTGTDSTSEELALMTKTFFIKKLKAFIGKSEGGSWSEFSSQWVFKCKQTKFLLSRRFVFYVYFGQFKRPQRNR